MSMSEPGAFKDRKKNTGCPLPRLGRNLGSIVDTCSSKVKLPTLIELTASSPRS